MRGLRFARFLKARGPGIEEFKHGVEPRAEVPTFVKGLKDMDELLARKLIEMRDHRIELVNHALLGRRVERTVVDAHRLGPFGIALVDCGEAAGEGDCALPERIVAGWARDGEGLMTK